MVQYLPSLTKPTSWKIANLPRPDPLFFLHHTQLDRIWWMWQQKDKERRLHAYHDSAEDPASADDVLPYEPLSANITVRDILDTETSMLCYRY